MDEYNILVKRMNRELHVCTPIFRDAYLHPFVNTILYFSVTFLNGETYMLSVTGKDAPTFLIPPHTEFTYTTNTNINGKDITLLAYINNTQLPELKEFYTPYCHYAYSYFDKVSDVNKIIPITVWSSIIKQYHAKLIACIERFNGTSDTNTFKQLQTSIETLRQIESVGLRVDESLFDAYFDTKAKRSGKDNFVYSEYNLYTTTGRPSNRFNGINFAALPKHDGTRSVFVSRFENGSLIQFDFDAYHLRLLGEYSNVSLPTTPLHEYLAKLYFNKSVITEEEYEASKQNTFSILYGVDVNSDIELLQNIKKISKQLYKEYRQSNQYILSPLFKRKIIINANDATENKIFNYFVQSLEFERTINKIKNIVKYLSNKKSKVILYTYDAILLDVSEDELGLIKDKVKDMLEYDGFPVKTYIGKNYEVMEKI